LRMNPRDSDPPQGSPDGDHPREPSPSPAPPASHRDSAGAAAAPSRDGAPDPDPPVTRREILGWRFYDVADSAFTTVIITTFSSFYSYDIVVGEPSRAAQFWGRANALSAVVIALLAPIAGAIADSARSRKLFLGVCAAMIAVFTALLGLTGPGTVMMAVTFYILANIGFAGGGVFIDSFLAGLATEK